MAQLITLARTCEPYCAGAHDDEVPCESAPRYIECTDHTPVPLLLVAGNNGDPPLVELGDTLFTLAQLQRLRRELDHAACLMRGCGVIE